jgi:hypothetical protein
MTTKKWLPYVHAFSFGWLSGIRGMAGPAFLSRHTAAHQPSALTQTPVDFMATK